MCTLHPVLKVLVRRYSNYRDENASKTDESVRIRKKLIDTKLARYSMVVELLLPCVLLRTRSSHRLFLKSPLIRQRGDVHLAFLASRGTVFRWD